MAICRLSSVVIPLGTILLAAVAISEEHWQYMNHIEKTTTPKPLYDRLMRKRPNKTYELTQHGHPTCELITRIVNWTEYDITWKTLVNISRPFMRSIRQLPGSWVPGYEAYRYRVPHAVSFLSPALIPIGELIGTYFAYPRNQWGALHEEFWKCEQTVDITYNHRSIFMFWLAFFITQGNFTGEKLNAAMLGYILYLCQDKIILTPAHETVVNYLNYPKCPDPCRLNPCHNMPHVQLPPLYPANKVLTVNESAEYYIRSEHCTTLGSYEDDFVCKCSVPFTWSDLTKSCEPDQVFCKREYLLQSHACHVDKIESCKTVCQILRSGKYYCKCQTYWAGERCEHVRDSCTDVNYHAGWPPGNEACGPHGTCTPITHGHTDFTCNCKPGYTNNPDSAWPDCTIFDVCEQEQHVCYHGNCSNKLVPVKDGFRSYAMCSCDPGFIGDRCERYEVISVENAADKKEADKMLTTGAAIGCLLVVIVAMCAWRCVCKSKEPRWDSEQQEDNDDDDNDEDKANKVKAKNKRGRTEDRDIEKGGEGKMLQVTNKKPAPS